jgi:undecaprenyl diphosphate synthase
VADHLYAPDVPDVDLLIRTSGERRLSNFLLWQSAYAELYFTDVLWPDFGPDELRKALGDYASRDRRFGGL